MEIFVFLVAIIAVTAMTVLQAAILFEREGGGIAFAAFTTSTVTAFTTATIFAGEAFSYGSILIPLVSFAAFAAFAAFAVVFGTKHKKISLFLGLVFQALTLWGLWQFMHLS